MSADHRFFVHATATLLVLGAMARRVEAISCPGSVSTGTGHTCSVDGAGAVRCWGENSDGQLGDGTTISRETATPVGLAGVAEVAAGGLHTCARKTDGTVWCWGFNGFGELGDGTNVSHLTPVQVTDLGTTATALAVGAVHSCARRQDGSLWCWGSNEDDAVGDGSGMNRSRPVQVVGTGVASFALGHSHTCAVTSGGGLLCWGSNQDGQLGDGTFTSHPTPLPVSGLSSGVTAAAAGGHHTCARRSDGTVSCWGSNFNGQLGDGTTDDRPVPGPVLGLTGVSVPLAGAWHSCAIKTDGTLWCWGWDGFGQLGDGGDVDSVTPVRAASLGNAVARAATFNDHACASKTDGTLWCWGDNTAGQVGDGTAVTPIGPEQVARLCSAAVPAAGPGVLALLVLLLAALAIGIGFRPDKVMK
jgi:alpha-tubulin suppressor-like RCC1 family protein